MTRKRRTDAPKLSWGKGSWWEDILDERDEAFGDTTQIWAPTARGAAGLGSYTGGHGWPRPASNDGVWELTDSLRFAKGLAGIVAKQKLQHISWHRNNASISFADVLAGHITLQPAAVLRAKEGTITLDAAKTIVGGIAIHEASHLAHTPVDHREKYRELMLFEQPQVIHDWTAEAGLALVEDAFVESAALAAYPGFVGYLDEMWREHYAPKAIEETLRQAVEGPEDERLGKLFEVIQDRSRRYDAPGPTYDALLARLPDDQATLVEAAGRILGRAHDATLAPESRRLLARDLARLLHAGEIAPRDRPDLGGSVPAPTQAQLDALLGLLDALRRAGKLDSASRGNRSAGIGGGLLQAITEAIDKDLQRETVQIVTNTGIGHATVAVLDMASNPRRTREEQRDVAPLVPPLAAKLRFRAVSPERRTGAQLRGHLEPARLVEFPLAQSTGRQPRAFMRRQAVTAPLMGVALLVDISGSMNSEQTRRDGTGTDRCTEARRASLVFDGALRGLKRTTHGGVDYSIYAHSTGGLSGSHDDCNCTLYRVIDERHPGDDRIGALSPRGMNYDGEAIAAVAQLAKRRWPDRERLLVYINDGMPNGQGYGGSPAHQAIRDHCNHLRATGTQVLTIYLGEGAPHDALATMYGPEGYGYIVVPVLEDLPTALGKVLTKVLKWQA